MMDKIKIIADFGLLALGLFGLPIFKGSHVKWEWRDMWVGVFFGKDAIYVCPFGFLVFVFPKNNS